MRNVLTGHGAPTIKTVGKEGQRYIDVDTGDNYICTDIETKVNTKNETSFPHDFVHVSYLNNVTSEYVWEMVRGGGGGSRADLVIRINADPSVATTDDIVIVSGSVEAVHTAFEQGKFPVVEVEIMVSSARDTYARGGYKVPAQVTFYGDTLLIRFIAEDIATTAALKCHIVYDMSDNYKLEVFVKKRISTETI